MRIYVDMDDTICDFTGAYNLALSVNPGIKYPQSQYGFFSNLEPIGEALGSMNRIAMRHDVWILTKPSVLNPLCYTEKRVWVEKYLGIEWCDKLIICPDKSLLKGDILIDDIEWPAFEGTQYLFKNNWEEIEDNILKTWK